MPTYQYRCKDCGESLEAVQSFADPALTECPECGGTLRKVFHSVGVVFKGSGFYRTDSRDKPDSADSQPKKTVDAKSDAKSDGKSDGKTETKSDSQAGTKSSETSTSKPASTSASSDSSSAA